MSFPPKNTFMKYLLIHNSPHYYMQLGEATQLVLVWVYLTSSRFLMETRHFQTERGFNYTSASFSHTELSLTQRRHTISGVGKPGKSVSEELNHQHAAEVTQNEVFLR